MQAEIASYSKSISDQPFPNLLRSDYLLVCFTALALRRWGNDKGQYPLIAPRGQIPKCVSRFSRLGSTHV